MTVVWTIQALDRLPEIEDFIGHENPIAAQKRTERLIARAETLAEHPHMGRIVPEGPRGELRELVDGNYRIVYRVRGVRVEILTVFESHRLLPVEDLSVDTEPES